MSGFAGNGPSGAGRLSRYQVTLLAGQATVSGKDDNGLTIRIPIGMESVYFKGRKLPPSDYLVTSSSITLPGGAAAGDVLEIYAPEVQTSANTFDRLQNGADIADKAIFAANVGISRPSILDNSDFRINQRVYTSAAVLSAGAYGHDRWKAGAAGGDYSFAQLASSTTITIAPGKSIIQVVEDKDVEGGTYVLSWAGTAQARVGVNSATPSGSYSASPLVINGQTAGTVMSVEFNAGTLGKTKLEVGSTPTPFLMQKWPAELIRCQRFYEKYYAQATPPGAASPQFMEFFTNTGIGSYQMPGATFKVTKRTTPTVILYSANGGAGGYVFAVNVNANVTTNLEAPGENGFNFYPAVSAGDLIRYCWTASSDL
jgi:hypothetical protein